MSAIVRAIAEVRSQASQLGKRSKPLVGLAVFLLGVWIVLSVFRGSDRSVQRAVSVLVFEKKTDPNNPYTIFGTYLLKSLQESLGKNRVVKEETVGSYDSLIRVDEAIRARRLLAEGGKKVGLAKTANHVVALAQADVVYHYIEGGHPQFVHPRHDSGVRSIAKLFHERLELASPFGRSSAAAAHAEAVLLREEKICGGEEGSGTRVTVLNAKRVLDASWKDLSSCGKHNISANATGFGEQTSNKNLIGFTLNAARVLARSLKAGIYEPTQLDAEAPPLTTQYTIMWPSFLVADRDLDNTAVKAVTAAVQDLDAACSKSGSPSARAVSAVEALRKWSDYCSVFKDWRSNDGTERDMPIALHPYLMFDRLDWLSRQVVRITEPSSLKFILVALLGSCILISLVPGLGLVVRSEANQGLVQRITAFLVGTRWQWMTMMAFAALFHVTIGVLVWLSELHAHALASDTTYVSGGLMRALEWTWYFVVMGASNIELQSNLALFWVGLLKAGWAVASGALLVALTHALYRGWRTIRMSDRAIVVGFNERSGAAVIRELKRCDIDPQRCPRWSLEGERDKEDPVTAISGTTFGQGGRAPQSDLEAYLSGVELQGVRGIIVLGDEEQAKQEGQGDTDLWVARQVRTIRAWLTAKEKTDQTRTQSLRRVRVVAEVQHADNIPIIRDLGADEAVCVSNFGNELLAQAVSKAGLCELLEDLLRTESNTHELYFDRLSEGDVQLYRTFERAVRVLAVERGDKIPIGLYKRDIKNGFRRVMNPRGEDGRLRAGDELICVSQRSTT